LFNWLGGAIAPVPPGQDQVVAHVHLVTDAHGFRNSPPEQATYDVVALGDSFTMARTVASPWPQGLAACAGMDVLNLGEEGAGPQQELDLFRQYGRGKQPQWVILTYFEGNDLYDAAAYAQANPFLLARIGKQLLTQGAQALKPGSRAQAAPAISYRYPITVTLNEAALPMAFLPAYVAWLSVDRERIAASQNYHVAMGSIQQMADLSDDIGAQFLLVFIPSKIHTYLPYLKDDETLARVFAGVHALDLDGAGYLQFTPAAATADLTRQHMDDQAGLLAEYAAEHNLRFLDLTARFQNAAATGEALYYAFDTHWNQQGHDLAAQAICQTVAAR
jgi:hypothetical protein